MRAACWFAAAAIALASVATAQNEARPAGDIEFDIIETDFGSILDDKVVHAEFTFTNKGDAPLTIKSMSSTCGCTKPELVGHQPISSDGKFDAKFEPGATGTIRVGFKPVGKSGNQDQAVTITTDDPDEPTVRLVIKAVVTPVVVVEPFQLALGNIPSGEPKTWTITVTGYAEGFRATRLALGGLEGFTTRTLETVDVETPHGPARRTTIEIIYEGGGQPGPITGYGLIRTTDPKRRFTGVAYTGNILGNLYAMPAIVNAGTQVAKRSSNPVTLRVHHREGKPFNIVEVREQSISGALPVNFEATPSPDNPGIVDVRLNIRAPGKVGVFDGSIWIKSDIEGEPDIEVKYRGTVADQ